MPARTRLAPPCYIVSDAHLGAHTRRAERELLELLDHVRMRGASLVINGDLFDFWFEWKTVIPRPAFPVLAALRGLTDRGVPIVWIGGNHDCWGGDVLRNDVGAWYQLEPWEGEIAGWKTRLEHGDGVREVEDKVYRRVRPILRSRLAIRAFRSLHPDLATRIALATSGASRKHGAPDEGDALRRVAVSTLSARGDLDLVVMAHSHVPALEQVGAGVFANAGGWHERPTFLVVERERITLREWDGSTDGTQLDSVDRRAKERAADGQKPLR